MGTKSVSGPSVRERARARRAELERARAAQSKAVEQAQVSYITVADKIAAANAKIEDAREALGVLVDQVAGEVAGHEAAQRDLVGALVQDQGQPVEDVAILLDLTPAQVRAARTSYRTARKMAAPATCTADTGPARSTDDAGSDMQDEVA